MIEKKQQNPSNFRIEMYNYRRARDAMFDVILQLYNKGYDNIFIPGYIGWSPKEGSGIFDPIEEINGLHRHYYRMTAGLDIDVPSFTRELKERSILLVVNYFGFRDKHIKQIIELAKQKECVVLEDNAHGFFTFFCNGSVGADVTFFSLHKMFPFDEGGAMVILNNNLGILAQNVEGLTNSNNPFAYNINAIAEQRKSNYRLLLSYIEGNESLFIPLRTSADIVNNVPQTLPIIIKCGNRDAIYEIMNGQGFGVTALYHTMISELKTEQHSDAYWLSKHIMNLPVHQDCNSHEYPSMVQALKKACIDTEQ